MKCMRSMSHPFCVCPPLLGNTLIYLTSKSACKTDSIFGKVKSSKVLPGQNTDFFMLSIYQNIDLNFTQINSKF
jgi:hypothetical protein